MLETRRLLALFIGVISLILPITSQAFTARSGDDVNFKSGDQLGGVTYAAGRQITVDTPLPGDLICAGNSVFINQPVQGDVICAAENISIRAKVDGTVRLIGSRLDLDNHIGGNAMLVGSDLIIGQQSVIQGESLIAAQFLDSRGHYLQDFHGIASQIKLYGQYDGPVNLTVANGGNSQVLQVNHGAKLAQGLTYRSKSAAQIDSAAEIKGEIVKKDWSEHGRISQQQIIIGWLWSKLLRLFMLLATGLVIISLWPRASRSMAEVANQRPVLLSAHGLLILIAMPLISVLAAMTIIGLPVAIILLLLWAILLYAARLVVGYWLGRRLWPKAQNNLWPFLVGVTILFIATVVPFIGWLISAIATWWGVGAIWQWVRPANKVNK
jgi:hypothetical protein